MASDPTFGYDFEDLAASVGQQAFQEFSSVRPEQTVAGARRANIRNQQPTGPEGLRDRIRKSKAQFDERSYGGNEGGQGLAGRTIETAKRGNEIFNLHRLYQSATDVRSEAATEDDVAAAEGNMALISDMIDAYQKDYAADPIEANSKLEKVVYGVANSALPMVQAGFQEFWKGAAVDLAIGTVGALIPEPTSTAAGIGALARGGKSTLNLWANLRRTQQALKTYKGATKATAAIKVARDVGVTLSAMHETFGKSHEGQLVRDLTQEGISYDIAKKVAVPSGWVYGAIEGILSPLALVKGGVGLPKIANETLFKVIKNATVKAGIKLGAGGAFAQQTEQVEEGLQGSEEAFAKSFARRLQLDQDMANGLISDIDAAIKDPKNQILDGWDIVEEGWTQYKEAFWATLGFGALGVGGNLALGEARQDFSAAKDIQSADATSEERDAARKNSGGDLGKEATILSGTVSERKARAEYAELLQSDGVTDAEAIAQSDAIPVEELGATIAAKTTEISDTKKAADTEALDTQVATEKATALETAEEVLASGDKEKIAELEDVLGPDEFKQLKTDITQKNSDIEAMRKDADSARKTRDSTLKKLGADKVERLRKEDHLNGDVSKIVSAMGASIRGGFSLREFVRTSGLSEKEAKEALASNVEAGQLTKESNGKYTKPSEARQLQDTKTEFIDFIKAARNGTNARREYAKQILTAEEYNKAKGSNKAITAAVAAKLDIGEKQLSSMLDGKGALTPAARKLILASEIAAGESEEMRYVGDNPTKSNSKVASRHTEGIATLVSKDEATGEVTYKIGDSATGTMSEAEWNERSRIEKRGDAFYYLSDRTKRVSADVSTNTPTDSGEVGDVLGENDVIDDSAQEEEIPKFNGKEITQESIDDAVTDRQLTVMLTELDRVGARITPPQLEVLKKEALKEDASAMDIKQARAKMLLENYDKTLERQRVETANTVAEERQKENERKSAARNSAKKDTKEPVESPEKKTTETTPVETAEEEAAKAQEPTPDELRQLKEQMDAEKSAKAKEDAAKEDEFKKKRLDARQEARAEVEATWDAKLSEKQLSTAKELVEGMAKADAKKAKAEEDKASSSEEDYDKALKELQDRLGKGEVRRAYTAGGGKSVLGAYRAWVISQTSTKKNAPNAYVEKVVEDIDAESQTVKAQGGPVDTVPTITSKLSGITSKARKAMMGVFSPIDRAGIFNPAFKQHERVKRTEMGGKITRTIKKYGTKLIPSDDIKNRSKKETLTVDGFTMEDGNKSSVRLKFGDAVSAAMQIMAGYGRTTEDKGTSNPVKNILKNGGFQVRNTSGGNAAKGYAKLFVKDKEQADAIISNMTPEVISEAERIGKVMDELYAELNEVFERVTGKKLTRREFYAHVVRATNEERKINRTTDIGRQGGAQHLGLMQVMHGQDPTSISEVKQLTCGGTASMLLLDAYNLSQKAINDSSKFIAMAEYVKDNQALLQDGRFIDAVSHRFGGDKVMRDAFLLSMSRDIESLGGTVENLDLTTGTLSKAIRKGLSNAAVAFLSDPFTSMKQFASYGNLAAFFGTDVFIASKAVKLSQEEIGKILKGSYGVIENRGMTFGSGLANVFDDTGVGGLAGNVVGPRGVSENISNIQNKGMGFTRKVDRFTVRRAMSMAKVAVDREWTGPKTDEYYAKIGQMADMAVMETQVQTSYVNRANIQRQKGGIMSGLTFMRGARSVSFSAITSSVERYFAASAHYHQVVRNGGDVAHALEAKRDAYKSFIAQMIYHGLLQGAMVAGINMAKWGAIEAIATAMYGPKKDDDDDEDMGKLMEFAAGTGENIAGLAPFGSLATTIKKVYFGNKKAGYQARRRLGSEIHPIAGLLDDITSTGIDISRLNRYNKEIESKKSSSGKDLTPAQMKQRVDWLEKTEAKINVRTLDFLFKWGGVPVARSATTAYKAIDRRKRNNQ